MSEETESNTDIIKKEWSRSKAIWWHGLLGAMVGGFANAGSSAFSSLVFGDDFKHSIERASVACVVGCFLAAFLYLKQSPVPPLPKDL